MLNRIFLPKWTDLLVTLYNTPEQQRYCGRLYRTTGITTRHLRDLVTQLEARDIIHREIKSKIKYVYLTDKGLKLAKLLVQIYPTLN